MDQKKQHTFTTPASSGVIKEHPSRYEVGGFRVQSRSLKIAQAYISRSNLRHNAALIKKLCPGGVKLCSVVKADAYGHDARLVVASLVEVSHCFAVSTIEEAEQIFPHASARPILVTCPLFAGMDVRLISLAQNRGFQCTFGSPEAWQYVEPLLDSSLPPLNVQVNIDTGMGRIGCSGKEALHLIQSLEQSEKAHLAGVYTHYATADEDDLEYTYRQLQNFKDFLLQCRLHQNNSVIKHTCNTSAALRVRGAHFDMVRCGIGLYGYSNFARQMSPKPIDLRPVLRLEAPLVHIKKIKAGQSCGYGRAFTAIKDKIIGVVPIGYADGLLRNLSDRAVMRCGQVVLPVIGRISMDFTILDLSELESPHEGMCITVIDDKPESPCHASAIAQLAETIPYEILTAIGNRVKRELVD